MNYHFKIHSNQDGFVAECIELDGCATEGDTLEDLNKNMEEALNLFLDEPADSKVMFPPPQKKVLGRSVVLVKVEPRVAFSFQLRLLRAKHKLTQKEVAQKMGISNLYNYQRLESSKTSNPALSTITKVKKVFPELSLDAVL